MSVRLLDSSSPAVSTHRRIISGQSGTADCRPPSVVRLLIYTPRSSNSIHHNYPIAFNHSILCIFRTTFLATVQWKYNNNFYRLFVAESSEPPTPHYNSSVLGDLLPRAHLQFLSAVSSQCSAFADGVALLKVWLRQRELDQVGGLKWFFCLQSLLPSFLFIY